MVWVSDGARAIGAIDILASTDPGDIPTGWERVIRRGWERRNGATVLVAWHRSYHGERGSRSYAAYESAVNGRGIPDDDLDIARSDRDAILLRRGLAFGSAALYQQQLDLPGHSILGEVSVTPTLYDPSIASGNVTFYTAPDDLTEFQLPGSNSDIVTILSTADCAKPVLPPRSKAAFWHRHP